MLKRGAVVGGGVLWVTPIVQTIGIGSAAAQAVSGAGSCSMPLNVTACVYEAGYYYLTFKAYIAPGCPCNPLPKDHHIYLDYENPYGFKNSIQMATFDDGQSEYSLGVSVGDML